MRSKLAKLGVVVAVAMLAVYVSGQSWLVPGWHAWLETPVTYAGLLFFLPAGLAYRFLAAPFLPVGFWDSGFLPPWARGICMVAAVIFCGIFWSTFLSRFFYFFGLWNPFVMRSRPWVLRGLTRIGDWWETLRRFGQQSTGGWASLIEVLSLRWERGDVFLGRPRLKIGGGMLRPVGLKTEKHMVTLAGTGAGKSTGALIPNLCIHEGSLLCVDPKGELAKITAARRGAGGGGVRGMGQDVYVLDPFRITGIPTASYNVFEEMARMAERDIDAPISYASKVAEALVPIESRDPFWDTAARSVIRGLILYVFQGQPGRRNLIEMRRLLMEGDKDALLYYFQKGDLTKKNDAFDALLTAMENCPEGPYKDAVGFAASTVLKMPENQRGSVWSIAQTHTAFLDLPEIKRVSQSSDFLLSDLQSRSVSVYLSLPLNMAIGEASAWLRMFILLVVDMMFRPHPQSEFPLLLAIDEFPSLGKLDGITLVAPTLRSQGVRLWVVGQDIEQFQATYPKSWGGFLGNAEAVQFLGIKHIETVDLIVKFLGSHLVQQREGSGNQRRMVGRERNLLDPNQVSRLLLNAKNNQIVWRGDARPLLLKVTPYFKYMPYWYYDRDLRYPEKWNRAIWRRRRRSALQGSDPGVPDRPGLPPRAAIFDPPRLPPGRKLPPQNKRQEDDWSGKILPPPTMKPKIDPSDPALIASVNDYISKMLPPKAPPPPPGEIILPHPRNSSLPPEIVNRLTPGALVGPDPLSELDNMIGLKAVKEQVEKTLSMILLSKARKQAGMPALDITHHLVFTGNPGTGKTTVARIIGRIYQQHGLLKSGHLVETDRAGLVASYLGQTAPLVESVVERALDGVLFIDEAYNLVTAGSDSYGHEAVATLLKLMEDKRSRLVVIVAGYKAEMKTFIDSNPGMQSRFRTYIDFPDYTPLEQMEILQSFSTAAQVQMSMDALRKAADVLVNMDHGKHFGNGRTVRNLFNEMITRQGLRLAKRGQWGNLMGMIEVDDVPDAAEIKA